MSKIKIQKSDAWVIIDKIKNLYLCTYVKKIKFLSFGPFFPGVGSIKAVKGSAHALPLTKPNIYETNFIS